jgi:hypothetical protein
MKFRKPAALASAERNSIAIEQIREFAVGVIGSQHEVPPAPFKECAETMQGGLLEFHPIKKIAFRHDMVPGHRRRRELRAAAATGPAADRSAAGPV